MNDLEQQLSELESELAEATREHALLNARIMGLRAHRDALQQILDQQAVSEHVERDETPLTAMSKSAAIVAVLRAAVAPMTIREIVAALQEAGRLSENYNGVSVYLQTLLSEGRVRRPERGHYVVEQGQ